MANNFATIFNTVETGKDVIPLVHTEIVTLDFVHEYVFEIKNAFKEIDNKGNKGRWNYEYMTAKVVAILVSRYSGLQFVPNASIFKGSCTYFFSVKPIPELYIKKDTPIEDTILITISDTKSGKILFDGVLSSYEKPNPEEY